MPDTTAMSRVTVVAPDVRVDLALPADVPLAHLLPTLLAETGVAASPGSSGRRWGLGRLGQTSFHADRTLTQLQVRDGEFLYLRPRDAVGTEAVFDDVVDALVTARESLPTWTSGHTRRAALAIGSAAAAAAALSLPFVGAPVDRPGLLGLVVGLALLAAAAGTQRRDPTLALVLICQGVGFAAVGGLVVKADAGLRHAGARQLLIAGTAVMIAATMGALIRRERGHLLAVFAVAAGLLVAAAEATVAGHADPAAVAAGATVLGLALLPALPMAAFRMARLSLPTIPTGADDPGTDTDRLDSAVLLQSIRAAELLGSMLAAVALLETGAAATLASSQKAAAVALACVVGPLLGTHARVFHTRSQRLPLLCGGAAVTLLCTVGGVALLTGPARLAVAAGVPLLLAVGCLGLAGSAAAGARRASPVWGRCLDLAELGLTAAVVPLAAWSAGIFGLVGS